MPCCAANKRKDTKKEREKGYTFHRFPHKQPECLKQWLVKMRRANYQPSSRALLCSAHFEEKCFYRFGQLTNLQADAVPTKFDFPAHLQKTEKTARRQPKDRGRVISEDSVRASPPEGSLTLEHGPSTSDHTYHVSTMSPRKLKRQLDESMERNLELKKKLKISHQKLRRLKKVTNLSETIDSLQENGLVSNGCADVLQKFSGAPRQLLERALGERKKPKRAYDDELRAFALTLQFYSTKADNFVRETFNLSLPHVTVIHTSLVQLSPWISWIHTGGVHCSPSRVEETSKKGRKVIGALMLDEMAIRKHVQWDGNQFHGYVSIGSVDPDDSTPIAKDALVIMVVAVNDSWKVPCGYFFINGMTGQERANLIETYLHRLHDVGVHIISLTYDGPSCHFSMLRVCLFN